MTTRDDPSADKKTGVSSDLVLTGSSALGVYASALAVALSGGGPLGVGVGLGALSIDQVSRYLEKRSRRKYEEKVRGVLRLLSARVSRVEITTPTEEELDLFAHIVDCAAKEEDKHKVDIHARVLAWAVEKKPPPALVRLVASAVSGLLYEELLGFVAGEVSRSARHFATDMFSTTTTNERLQRHGLIPSGSVRLAGTREKVGDVLFELCKDLKSESDWLLLSHNLKK
ncbi:MAG TPA: hypothetical protein VD971_11610 [Phycisphaerales bacterium]|nr:hypothetical protein [Phycisphaerales bacterium]